MTAETEIRQVLAHYVRATDARDGTAQGSLFTDDAEVRMHVKTGQGQYDANHSSAAPRSTGPSTT